jgi:hypothetical protein
LLSTIDWTRPWFLPFAASASRLVAVTCARLSTRRRQPQRPRAAAALRAAGQLPEGVAYESHIFATGQVPTRDNLHDAFNALIWLHFPRPSDAQPAASRGHRAGRRASRARGLRDAATLFDENAVILVSEDATLADALRGLPGANCLSHVVMPGAIPAR